MPEFLSKVDWFSFIVGGIFVSFLVNIAASFAFPKIQKWWNDRTEKGRLKNNIYALRIEHEINRLIENPHEELVARQKVLLWYIVYAVGTLLFIFPVVLIPLSPFSTFVIIFIQVLMLLIYIIFLRANLPVDLRAILDAIDKVKGRPLKNADFYRPYTKSENKKAPEK